ncbi:amidohydrolase [Salinifilum aidingensis]
MRSAELLVVGTVARTLDPERPRAHAIAVHDGRIVALDDDALALSGKKTEVVDVGGATTVPGLVDGHMHPILAATSFTGTDLSACRDLDAVRSALAATRPDGSGWVRAFGLNHNAFGQVPITRELLDELLPGVPVFVYFSDCHSALVSTEALRRANVTGPREFEQRAQIVCDERGRPTGFLVEHAAMQAVAEAMPAVPLEEVGARVREDLRRMAATGLTGGTVMDAEGSTFSILEHLESRGELPLRLRVAPWCMPGDDIDESMALHGRRGRRWAVDLVKFFIDGTVENGSAWLHHADCFGQNTDAFWRDPAEYTAAVRRLAEAKVPTATHAIGDAGVGHVIDSFTGIDTGGVRHRVEHLETLPREEVRRLVDTGLVASMQPSHAGYVHADRSDDWSVRLGTERAARAWPCRDVRAAGGILVLGSDWPVAAYDARGVLAHARLRCPPGSGEAPVRPDQALTGIEALEGMTTHSAIADGVAGEAGRIAVGCRADLTALAVDPVAAPADEVGEADVRLTVSSGLVTHRAD